MSPSIISGPGKKCCGPDVLWLLPKHQKSWHIEGIAQACQHQPGSGDGVSRQDRIDSQMSQYVCPKDWFFNIFFGFFPIQRQKFFKSVCTRSSYFYLLCASIKPCAGIRHKNGRLVNVRDKFSTEVL